MNETIDKTEDSLSNASGSLQTTLRVLVVDDNVASAKMMGWAIELLGHDIRTANDGADALATALDFRPHVILLDLSLPGLNGYELCRIMRAEHGFEDTLFIAQTGWGDAEHRKRSREAGFVLHLLKPVDMVKLEGLLKARATAEAVD